MTDAIDLTIVMSCLNEAETLGRMYRESAA